MRAKRTKTYGVLSGDEVPGWILDELKRDSGLLDAVAAVVRVYRKRSPSAKIPRR